ncbi:hypothetical protein B0I35DRAFT_430236 [Stachybotrys elegans]|uniref:Uncharacterized protein n=1 Tax=Stachybotrys elegans TaxID=80388 RepID=A0A8K0SXV7_9HYPO|nr:hypothetical protein B0I35DRAFT_430236 [Stachybotrys elegans]
MHCFQTANAQNKPATRDGQPSLSPVQRADINCRFTLAPTIKCSTCVENGAVCSPPYAIMEGNVIDLNAIMDWFDVLATMYDERDNAEIEEGDCYPFVFPRTIRRRLVAIFYDLCAVFIQVDKIHRRGAIAMGAQPTSPSDLSEYRSHVLARRQLLLALNPRPVEPVWACLEPHCVNEARNAWLGSLDNWKQTQVLRLAPTDPGYIAWCTAIQIFRDSITSIAHPAVLSDSVSVVDIERVLDHFEKFPIDHIPL